MIEIRETKVNTVEKNGEGWDHKILPALKVTMSSHDRAIVEDMETLFRLLMEYDFHQNTTIHNEEGKVEFYLVEKVEGEQK